MFVVVEAEMEEKSKNWICDSEEKDFWPLVKLQNIYVSKVSPNAFFICPLIMVQL